MQATTTLAPAGCRRDDGSTVLVDPGAEELAEAFRAAYHAAGLHGPTVATLARTMARTLGTRGKAGTGGDAYVSYAFTYRRERPIVRVFPLSHQRLMNPVIESLIDAPSVGGSGRGW